MDWIAIELLDDEGADLSLLRLKDGARQSIYHHPRSAPLSSAVHPGGGCIAVNALSRSRVQGQHRSRIGLINLEKEGTAWLRWSLDPKWRVANASFDQTGGRLALEGRYGEELLPNIYLFSLSTSGGSPREELLAGTGSPKSLASCQPYFIDHRLYYFESSHPEGRWEICLLDPKQKGSSAAALEERAPSVWRQVLTRGAEAIPEVGLITSAENLYFVARSRGGSRQRVQRLALDGKGEPQALGRNHRRIDQLCCSPDGQLLWSADGGIWCLEGEEARLLVAGGSQQSHGALCPSPQGLLFVTQTSESTELRRLGSDGAQELLCDLGDVTILSIQLLPPNELVLNRLEAELKTPELLNPVEELHRDEMATVIEPLPPMMRSSTQEEGVEDLLTSALPISAEESRSKPLKGRSTKPPAGLISLKSLPQPRGLQILLSEPKLQQIPDATPQPDESAIPVDLEEEQEEERPLDLEEQEGEKPLDLEEEQEGEKPLDLEKEQEERLPDLEEEQTELEVMFPTQREAQQSEELHQESTTASISSLSKEAEADLEPPNDETLEEPLLRPKQASIKLSEPVLKDPQSDFVGWIKQLIKENEGQQLLELEGFRQDLRLRDSALMYLRMQMGRSSEDKTPLIFAISAAAHLKLVEAREQLSSLCQQAQGRLEEELPELEEHYAITALLYINGQSREFHQRECYQEYEEMLSQLVQLLETEGAEAAAQTMHSFGTLYRDQLERLFSVEPEPHRSAEAELRPEVLRLATERRRASSSRGAEAARQEEVRRAKEAERARQAEEAERARQVEEAKRAEQRRMEEEVRRAEEEVRRAEEEAKRAEERAQAARIRAHSATPQAQRPESSPFGRPQEKSQPNFSASSIPADPTPPSSSTPRQHPEALKASFSPFSDPSPYQRRGEETLERKEQIQRTPQTPSPRAADRLTQRSAQEEEWERRQRELQALPELGTAEEAPLFLPGPPPLFLSVAGGGAVIGGVVNILLGFSEAGALLPLGLLFLVAGVGLFADRPWGWFISLGAFLLNGLYLLYFGFSAPPEWWIPPLLPILGGMSALGFFGTLLLPQFRERYTGGPSYKREAF